MHAVTLLVMLAVLFLLGGTTFVRKFLRGFFRGVDLYVLLNVDGKTVAYKNPRGLVGLDDTPLDMLPYEILSSDQFETYYNVCWWAGGTLLRCEPSFHRTGENARYCDKNIEGTVIGKVLEER
jgi:hypothetical protein